ncbi:hypothetical protein [Nocardioides currus]|uniref:Uncharacterized protein n=1 Tax=Nocardioides currus TaxID=2133958 RepID=A0A2R7YRK8_9ACTN|nr:hypothetical protein [Nocardioides currus]PUA79045.1 hypothetical protein C7S10_21470 [Nocardioides currus]
MRRTLAVAVLTVWVLLGLPATAHAGGPTSVLITQPAAGRATALYYTAGEYAELERLITSEPHLGDAEAPGAGDATTYQLTWLLHDVQVWRTDALTVADDGSVFVRTVFLDGTGGPEVGDTGPRRVVRGPELAVLLDKVVGRSAAAATAVQPVQPMGHEPTVAPAAAEPTTRWFTLAGWRWLVPGLVAGLLLGFLAVRRGAPPEPRRVLVDVSPSDEPARRGSAVHP